MIEYIVHYLIYVCNIYYRKIPLSILKLCYSIHCQFIPTALHPTSSLLYNPTVLHYPTISSCLSSPLVIVSILLSSQYCDILAYSMVHHQTYVHDGIPLVCLVDCDVNHHILTAVVLENITRPRRVNWCITGIGPTSIPLFSLVLVDILFSHPRLYVSSSHPIRVDCCIMLLPHHNSSYH